MHRWDEQFKTWMRKAYLDKEPTSPPNPAKWMKLLGLIQFMWEHRTIPIELGWKIRFFILKVNEDIQGIGLIEVLWNIMERTSMSPIPWIYSLTLRTKTRIFHPSSVGILLCSHINWTNPKSFIHFAGLGGAVDSFSRYAFFIHVSNCSSHRCILPLPD